MNELESKRWASRVNLIAIVINVGVLLWNLYRFAAKDSWLGLGLGLLNVGALVILAWSRRRLRRFSDGRCPEIMWVRSALEAPRVALRCSEDAGHAGAHVAPYQAYGPPVEVGGSISAHSEMNIEFTGLGVKWWEVPVHGDV